MEKQIEDVEEKCSCYGLWSTYTVKCDAEAVENNIIKNEFIFQFQDMLVNFRGFCLQEIFWVTFMLLTCL